MTHAQVFQALSMVNFFVNDTDPNNVSRIAIDGELDEIYYNPTDDTYNAYWLPKFGAEAESVEGVGYSELFEALKLRVSLSDGFISVAYFAR